MNIAILFLVCQTELFQPQDMLNFADHLFAQEDYAAALHEYRRYIFLGDSTTDELYAKIIECLIQLDRYPEAIRESKHIHDANKRNYTLGLVFFTGGEMDSSRVYLNQVTIPYEDDARELLGFGYAYEFNFEAAADYVELPKQRPSQKKPALGALFSIFPGGGHFYAGRYGDGFYSLLLVSTASLLSYYYYDHDEDIKFGFALGTAILLYAGNIYGGINSVRNYNYYENQKYLQEIIEDK
jgi:hypothetical protein